VELLLDIKSLHKIPKTSIFLGASQTAKKIVRYL
jgi:hypothetical protein